MTEKRFVFVDADSILYSSAYGTSVSEGTMHKRFQDRLNYIRTQTFADELLVAVKGYDNFRDKLDPEYKAQRKPQEDEMRQRLRYLHGHALELGAFQSDGWEADDQVRSWAWEAQEEGHQWVIAGIDKDLLQIPGTHFNYGGTFKKPLPEDKKWNFINQEEGDYRLACQLLTGDTVDNITGIKNVGPKKAEKALKGKTRKEMMTHVISLYQTEFNEWEKKLYTNCNLIYMRRWLDDEFLYENWLNE